VPAASNNLLLAGLATRVRNALLEDAETVTLRSGERLWEARGRAAYVLFPIDCSVALMADFEDEPTIEAGLIGHEGMVGVPLVLGMPICAFGAVVQGSGRAWRVAGPHLTTALDRHGGLRERLNRYACLRLLQLAQGAGCRSLHRVEGRLARWLLMSRDRERSDELGLTHEFLAHMLGVRRAGVTIAAHALQDRQLIRYARGRIRVLDGRGLEAAACACYVREKKTYESMLG
jgi:CRP-like cAMP-binding protein